MAKINTKYVFVEIKLKVNVENGVSLEEALEDFDYEFKSNTDGVAVADTEWISSEIK